MKYDRIILASASPRRKELIRYLNYETDIIPSSAEEIIDPTLKTEEIPQHLALLKARDVAGRYPDSVVIGCDTVVIIDGKILGKPKDREDAKRMLHALSGRTHRVITGCALVKKDICRVFYEESSVTFYELIEEQIDRYLQMDEYADKAGAYAIQGKGMLFVRGVHGDYPNIVGLPVAKLERELEQFISSDC